MIFRIMCRTNQRTEAYAEILDSVEVLANNRVYCIDLDGSCCFTDRWSIMFNPTIIMQINRRIYKIKLDGSVIPEPDRAGKKEE